MAEVEASNRRKTLLIVSSGNVTQLGCRLLIGTVVPLLLVHVGTTRSTIGTALTGMWAVYALMQFPNGVLADGYGERLVLLAVLVATGSGVLLVAVSQSIVLITSFVLLLGAGAGSFFAPRRHSKRACTKTRGTHSVC